MKLYIQIKDGLPVNHPALEDNLIDALGDIPDDWEPFIRIEDPTISNSNIVLTQSDPTYENVDGIWQDVWHYRDKTTEEIQQEKNLTIELLHQQWQSQPYSNNFSAWTFDEEYMVWNPPFAKPKDGKFYRWSGKENNWKECPPPPQDVKTYFDFDNWTYVEIGDNNATANNG